MKVLRLLHTVNFTSGPYNQLTLGMVGESEQTVCAFYPHECEVDKNIIYHEGNGTVFGMISLLRNILYKNDYDVIHVHSGQMGLILVLGLFPLYLKKLRHAIFTLHTSFHLLSNRNKILVSFTSLCVKKTNACSKSSFLSIPNWLRRVLGNKLIVIVNSFNGKKIESLSTQSNNKKLFSNLDGLKMVCVGTLNDNKNQIEVLNALKLSKRIRGQLIFLGGGPNRKKLEKYAETINSNVCIQFKGKVSRDLTIQYMYEADIFLSLSKGEGMPLAVLEAMGAGCYAILSNIPPHREINAPSGSCKFVNLNNIEELSKLLNGLDNKNIKSINKAGAIARDYVFSNFHIKKMLDQYYELMVSIGRTT